MKKFALMTTKTKTETRATTKPPTARTAVSMVATVTMLALMNSAVHAAEDVVASSNPAVFGESCIITQGSWTAKAMSMTSQLEDVAKRLHQDPNCNILAGELNSAIVDLDKSSREISLNAKAADKMSTLSEEASALRTYAKGDFAFKSEVATLLLNNAFNSALTAAEVKSETSTRVADGIYSFSQRVERATTNGLDILNRVMDRAVQEEKCLVSPNTLGPFMSTMVSMASVFLSSRQDGFGSKVALLVNKIAMMAREKKFAATFKSLYRTQFANSMSCLLEVVSENYCSSMDAKALFDFQMEQIALTASDKTESDQKEKTSKDDEEVKNLEFRATRKKIINGVSGSPLDGFYILSQQLPIVTSWIDRLMRGIDPMNEADADFKNTIINNTNNFYIARNGVIGAFKQSRLTLEALSNEEARKNLALRILNDMSNKMAGTSAFPGGGASGKENFFLQAENSRFLPFTLLGMRTIPDEVRGKTSTGMALDPSTWLDNNYKTIPEFANPMQTVDVIEKNVFALIDKAEANAMSYFNEWFIYDQAALFLDSVTGMTYNVPDVLMNIQQYLILLQKRSANESRLDPITLQDTINKLQKILDIHANIQQLGAAFLKETNADKKNKLVEKGRDKFKELINTVSSQLMVFKGRSSLLVNRLASFVKLDLQSKMRDGLKFNDEQVQLIFYHTGNLAFDNMKTLAGANPFSASIDISNAQTINKENLKSLEILLSDSFAASIAYYKMIAENQRPNNDSIFWDSLKRAYFDFVKPDPAASAYENAGGFIQWWRPLRFPGFFYGNPDRYPRHYSLDSNHRATSDNEFGAARLKYSIMCMQALAFEDQRPFTTICKDAYVPSPFSRENLSGPALAKFEDTLDLNYNKFIYASMYEDGKKTSGVKNHSKRICAVRSTSRNNHVVWLTLGLKSKN